MTASVLFFVSNLCAAGISILVARMALRGREPWRRVLAAAAGFPVVVVVVLLVLGNAGRLSAVWATGAVVVVMGVVAFGWWRWSGRRVPEPGAARAEGSEDSAERLRLAIAIVMFAAFAWSAVERGALSGTHFGWDDFSYHGPPAAQWLVEGRIVLPHKVVHAYYPYNAELLSLWFMLPFRCDALVSLCGLYWVGLGAGALAALALAVRCRGSTALVVAALLLASPPVLRNARTFSASDLAGMASALAALAFALPSPGGASTRSRVVDGCYAGLLAGMAAACRVALAPVSVMLLVFLLLTDRKATPLRVRAMVAGAFALCVALTGSYWFVRNLVLTGNPVFPAALGPFPGPWASGDQLRSKLIYALAHPQKYGHVLVDLAKGYIHWPTPLLVFVVIGYLAGLVALVRGWRGESRGAARDLLLVVGLVMAAFFLITPFSVGGLDIDIEPMAFPRFVFLPFALGLVLFATVVDRGERGHLWFALALLGFVAAWRAASGGALHVVVAGAVLVVWRLLRGSAVWRRALVALVPVGLIFFALWQPRAKELTARWIFGDAKVGRPAGKGWQFVNGLPKGARITCFGRADHFVPHLAYPLYGRDMQLAFRPVLPDGSPLVPLHERWRRDPDRLTGTLYDPSPDLRPLVENLRKSGIEYVFATKWGDREWPAQYAVLERSQHAKTVYRDEWSVLWQLRQAEGGRHSDRRRTGL